MNRLDTDIAVLCLVKGEERYVVMVADDQRDEALRTLGRWAGNPELSFNWWDVAYMAKRLREMSQ